MLLAKVKLLEQRLAALEGEDGAGSSDGESFPITTGECKHDAEGLWAPQMNATKCKGVKWNAANGENVETNPVCWDTKYKGWQEEGVNPWVVGKPRRYNSEAYDARRKCAGKSGGSLRYCASEGWWNLEAAQSTSYKGGGGILNRVTLHLLTILGESSDSSLLDWQYCSNLQGGYADDGWQLGLGN